MTTREEMKQLYDQHEYLINITIGKNFNNKKFHELHGITPDMIYQSGRIGLQKACETYDESKGATFKTYAIYCIKWTISDEAKRDSLGSAEKWTFDLADRTSLDRAIEHTQEGEPVTLYDLIGTEDENYNNMELEDKYKLIETVLSKQIADIIRLKAQGYTCMDVAKYLGVSHQSVSYLLRRHKDAITNLIMS